MRQRLALTRAAQRWSESDMPPEGLLTGWQLQEAKRQTDLSELEREFVEASAEAVDRAQQEKEEALRREAEQAKALAQAEQRLRRRTNLVLAIVAVTTVAAMALAIHFWQKTQYLDRRSVELQKDKAELSLRQSELQEKYARLQADYNTLFAKQVQQAVATVSGRPSGHAVTIFLHISAAEQRPRAEEIAWQLRQNGIKVPGIEQVKPVAQSEVRYFRKEDEAGARDIVSLLNKYLGVEARMTPTLVKGFEQKVPGRQYEIWFAPGAFSSPYGLPEPKKK